MFSNQILSRGLVPAHGKGPNKVGGPGGIFQFSEPQKILF